MNPFLTTLIEMTLSLCAPQEATLLFAGDAMMHQAQIDAARTADGKYDYSECFSELSDVITAADYAVVNLETPLGEKGFTGYPCFNAPVAYAVALKNAGFDMFLTANNHTLDRRDKGLRFTVSALDSLNVDHIGTYTDPIERQEKIPFVKSVNGFRIGFLNYTYGTNGISVTGNAVVDYINADKISSDIKATRDAGAEIIVAAMHWGEEYTLRPVAYERQWADFLTRQGVDIIVGGHPHVVQPLEIRENPVTGKPVAMVYSLGNFLSNMKTRDTRGGMVATIRLTRDSVGNATVTDPRYRLVFTAPPAGTQKAFKVYPAEQVPSHLSSRAHDFINAALPLFQNSGWSRDTANP